MEYGEGPRTRNPRNLNKTKISSTSNRYLPGYTSESWNDGKGLRIRKNNNINRNTVTSKSFETPCQRYTAMRKQMQRRYLGPDPTVPHLKYGIFPKRPKSSIPTKIEPPMHKPVRFEQMDRFRRESQRSPKIVIKDSKPVTIENNLDNRLMRQLSISASTHVDIKPQRYLYNMEKTKYFQ